MTHPGFSAVVADRKDHTVDGGSPAPCAFFRDARTISLPTRYQTTPRGALPLANAWRNAKRDLRFRNEHYCHQGVADGHPKSTGDHSRADCHLDGPAPAASVVNIFEPKLILRDEAEYYRLSMDYSIILVLPCPTKHFQSSIRFSSAWF
jgi:hypothetical protein